MHFCVWSVFLMYPWREMCSMSTYTSAILFSLLLIFDDSSSLVAQTVKNPLQCWRPGFDPWVGKIPWRRAWQPTPVFLPGESPWTEEPGGLQSMRLQRDGHDWATKHICIVDVVVQPRFWSLMAWVPALAQLLTTHVILGRLLNLSVPCVIIYKLSMQQAVFLKAC